mmetsp:Transcript_8494/g.12505  ORF Transcript_8494/g.12505 Transcript_8494/m.12505 type:complete len:88 (-) Transcript_8494:16-279(-)
MFQPDPVDQVMENIDDVELSIYILHDLTDQVQTGMAIPSGAFHMQECLSGKIFICGLNNSVLSCNSFFKCVTKLADLANLVYRCKQK